MNGHFEESGDLKSDIADLKKSMQSPSGNTPDVESSIASLGDRLAEDIKNAVEESNQAQEERFCNLVDQITENVKEALLGLQAGSNDPGSMEGPLKQLRETLQELEELRALPEKISGLLRASDEAQQFGINAAMQEATDQIIGRLEEIGSG